MKAAVCYGFGQPLVIEDLVMRAPHPDEVRVKVVATAICHSDLHDIHGDFGGGLPFVGGHETAGYVEEVGSGVTSVAPGDPVVVSLLESCGECFYCTHGPALLLRDQGHVRRPGDPQEPEGRGSDPESPGRRLRGVRPGARVAACEDPSRAFPWISLLSWRAG